MIKVYSLGDVNQMHISNYVACYIIISNSNVKQANFLQTCLGTFWQHGVVLE